MPECGHVCRNMYTCDCMDYRARSAMVCKHVHGVHSKFFHCVETRNEDLSPPVVMLAENDVPDEGQLEFLFCNSARILLLLNQLF